MAATGAGAGLAGFLQEAGRSLGEAQGALVSADAGVPQTMAISEAELEVKAGLASDGGRLRLETISTAEIRKGGLEPGLLSTIRIRYVAVAVDTAPGGAAPARTVPEVIDDVKARPDVVAIDRILGGLRYEAAFLAPAGRWVVTAFDSSDRIVREVVVVDEVRRG
jgi:hypothetical protein